MTFEQQPPAPPTPPDPPSPPDAAPIGPPPQGEPPIIFTPDGDGGISKVTIKDGKIVIDRETGETQTLVIKNLVPSGAVDIVQAVGVTLILLIVGFPISRAIARWIDRRSSGPRVPQEVTQRMKHLEETLENVALEIERISEGQRFTTRLLAEEQREPLTVSRDART